MRLKVYKPEDILLSLVVEYDDMVTEFISVPKFIGCDERLVLDVRFNTRTGDIEVIATRTEWFDESSDSRISRNIPVSGDIQGTFLQPFASRMSDGIRLALAENRNSVIC